MSPVLIGALLGAALGGGLALVISRVLAVRRTPLSDRVLPWVRETASADGTRPSPMLSHGSHRNHGDGVLHAASGLFGPVVGRAAGMVESVLGGGASVAARLERSASPLDLHAFRVEQVQWGLAAFGVMSLWQVWGLFAGDGGLISSLVLCVGSFVVGVLARDRRLSAAADARDREVVAEFPVVAELLALSVASGEGPVAALDRVVRRSHGAMSEDLARVLAQVRTGTPVARAFEQMAATSAVPVVVQFAHGVAVAVDRGTPLADVLHAQASDVREAGRRTLIESAARKEIYMLAPVVFLVLPVTVLFAFYPGLIGLRMTMQ